MNTLSRLGTNPHFSVMHCSGILVGRHEHKRCKLSVEFDVVVESNGEVTVKCVPQPLTAANCWIMSVHASLSATVAQFELRGKNSSSQTVFSRSVWLTAVETPSTPSGTTLVIRASCNHLVVRMKTGICASASRWTAVYAVPGLQCFGAFAFADQHGEVVVRGSTALEEFSQVSGVVSISCNGSGSVLRNWHDECDSVARRTLDLLSLANGQFLQVVSKSIWRDDMIVRCECFGSHHTAKPYKPPFHYLNYQQSIGTVVSRYTDALIRRTGLDVAIEWHVMPHEYNESRFVAQMTALEHLVHVYSEFSPETTYLDKKVFKTAVASRLVDALIESLEKIVTDDRERQLARIGLEANVRGINRKSLRASLEQMLAAYGVPLDGLSDVIPRLIETRNMIVHRGISEELSNGKSLGWYLGAAEELLRRTILALLNYRGMYRSWWPDEIIDREFCKSEDQQG